jgi:hypothetical protein
MDRKFGGERVVERHAPYVLETLSPLRAGNFRRRGRIEAWQSSGRQRGRGGTGACPPIVAG